MKERPILFSGPMVRAILEGRKTQTRRLIQAPRWSYGELLIEMTPPELPTPPSAVAAECRATGCLAQVQCPYGAPGDLLWVRECWAPKPGNPQRLYFRADGELGSANIDRWHPSIHMCRTASRLTLEITDVRVQRLQEISEKDARAEGIREWDQGPLQHRYGLREWEPEQRTCDARGAFSHLWNSINAKRAPWESNPWVWALSFRRVAP